MAVFTQIHTGQVVELLRHYELGDYVAHEPIVEGSENTNYKLNTTAGDYALTLFEERTPADAPPFFLALQHLLGKAGMAVPAPQISRSGGWCGEIQGRTVAIGTWLPGASTTMPNLVQCFQAGRTLARMHLAAAHLPCTRPNPMGPASWETLLDEASRALGDAQLIAELRDELAWLLGHWPSGLAQGPIHADYFPDNILFEGNALSGVIDFCFACTDMLALDLAIAHSAWGFSSSSVPRVQCMVELVRGYQSERLLSTEELQALPVLCRGAALRFTLTRLCDSFRDKGERLRLAKDPMAYKRRLDWYRDCKVIPTEHADALC